MQMTELINMITSIENSIHKFIAYQVHLKREIGNQYIGQMEKNHKCSTKKQTKGKHRRENKKHKMGGSNIHAKIYPEEKQRV